MASVEAGGTRSRGGQRIQPLPSPNPPQRLDGILLREHDEDLDRLGRFLASTPDVARSRTTSTSTPRLRPPSAGRDRPAAPDPVGQPQRCRAAFERWGADRTPLADGL
jgi:hypothetical protein